MKGRFTSRQRGAHVGPWWWRLEQGDRRLSPAYEHGAEDVGSAGAS